MHTVLSIVGVVFVTAVAVTFIVLLVKDLRGNGELSPEQEESQHRHEQRDAQRRVNKDARGGGMTGSGPS